MCANRMEPYDLLPPEIRKAIAASKWGISVDVMWGYVDRLRFREWSISDIITDIEAKNRSATKHMYRAGVLKREFGDGTDSEDGETGGRGPTRRY